MNSGINPTIVSAPIYLHSTNLSNYLVARQNYCLFLDVDGTLAHFTLDPKDSFIPDATLTILKDIQNSGVSIAIVTGRSLVEAKQMLSPLELPIAATHGLEIAFDGKFNSDISKLNGNSITSMSLVDREELATIKQSIIQSCMPYPSFTIEDKPYSVALHYRQNPALADIAYSSMSKALENYSNWVLKQGKYVWEIVPKGVDKGAAILTLLEKMQTNHELCPIFIGDDITDEAGFMVVQSRNRLKVKELAKNSSMEQYYKPVSGMGIKVGSEPTSANYYVNNIDEVTTLLKDFLAFCQAQVDLCHESKPLSSTIKNTKISIV